MIEEFIILTQIIFIDIILAADNAIIIGLIAANFVPKNRKQIILKTKAPATPHRIICFLFFGTKFAAINPIMIALSAAKIISINIIWVKIMNSSIKIDAYY